MADFQRYIWGAAVKVQAAKGTYSAPLSDGTMDLFLQTDATMASPEFKSKTIDPMSANSASQYNVVTDPSNPKASFSLSQPVPVAQATGSSWEALLQSAGLEVSAITTPAAGFEYVLGLGSSKVLSLNAVSQRHTTQYKDALSDLTINCPSNDHVMFDFSFTSTQNGDVVEIATGASDNTIPAKVLNLDTGVLYIGEADPMTINGVDACTKDVSIVLGAKTHEDECMLGKARQITGFAPQITLTVKLTKDFEASFNDIKNNTTFAITIPLITRAGVRKGLITIPNAVVTSNSASNNTGLLEVTRTLDCRETSGDDNISIQFYS